MCFVYVMNSIEVEVELQHP